jgi:hypothetical protein
MALEPLLLGSVFALAQQPGCDVLQQVRLVYVQHICCFTTVLVLLIVVYTCMAAVQAGVPSC